MKEKLPIWFQAMALVCLSGVFLATLWWVGHTDRTLFRQGVFRQEGRFFDEPAIVNIVYYLMPLSIAWLGGRFLWSFRRAEERRTVGHNVFYVLGVCFAL